MHLNIGEHERLKFVKKERMGTSVSRKNRGRKLGVQGRVLKYLSGHRIG